MNGDDIRDYHDDNIEKDDDYAYDADHAAADDDAADDGGGGGDNDDDDDDDDNDDDASLCRPDSNYIGF